jgi:hypothetical protein
VTSPESENTFSFNKSKSLFSLSISVIISTPGKPFSSLVFSRSRHETKWFPTRTALSFVVSTNKVVNVGLRKKIIYVGNAAINTSDTIKKFVNKLV